MKKTLLTFSVFSAVICCTLAYAVTGHGPLAHFINKSASNDETKSTVTVDETTVATTSKQGLKIDEESILRATSRVASSETGHASKTPQLREGNVEEIVVDLWNDATQISPLQEGGSFDATTNTLTFPGSVETSNQIFAGTDTSGSYEWRAVEGQNYQFTGTLTSDSTATVYPCILYLSGSTFYIANNVKVVLDETNNYTSEFHVAARQGINKNAVLAVAFLVENSSTTTTVTSTNNKFFYSYTSLIAQEWSSENDLPGLGLSNFRSGTYTVLCEDGITTLGLYKDNSWDSLYLTGINTTATEVSVPKYVTIDNSVKTISYLGYSDAMDWTGAPNIASLNITLINSVRSSFSGSSITDLYVGQNCSFDGSLSGNENIYLHIPYSASRSNFTSYGFKRVLVGEEQPNYPVPSYASWVIAGENEGDFFGISLKSGNFSIVEIFTEKESLNVPAVTPYDDGNYYIRYFGSGDSNSSTLCKSASALKSVSIPDSYNYVGVNWLYNPITDLHMLGDVPETRWGLSSNMNVYVANQSYYINYLSNSKWNNANILQDGWDFAWITVNVEKPGEFAEAYLTQNNYDWSAAQYLKVTGNINETDLKAIKNLKTLLKLDLSETTISELPSSFMYNRTTLVEVKLPATLTKIGKSAFSGCTELKIINLKGIKSIGESSFSGCGSLKSINLNGVHDIGSWAFCNCSKLNNIDLSTVEIIGGKAFENCSSLEYVDLSSAVNIGFSVYDDWNSRAVGYTFHNCTSLKTVEFGSTRNGFAGLGIWDSSFSNTGLESVILPEGTSDLSDGVFENCSNLTRAEIPTSVEYIRSRAFSGCSKLSNVSLYTGLVSIEESAFYGCKELEEITIPSTVNSIGSSAFDNTGIKIFRCYAVVPPTATSSFIGGNMDMNRTYLYVPPFSKDFYRNTQYWSDFYLMKSLEDEIDYILVNRPLTINLEEEDNAAVANNPEIKMTCETMKDEYGSTEYNIGQLTSTGKGTLSAGQMTVVGQLSNRNNYSYQYVPTLINYADKMRADNVSFEFTFYNYYKEIGEWHFISLPYDVRVSDIVPTNDTYWVIRRYDSAARAAGETSSTWVNLSNDDTIEAGKGYIVSAVGTYVDVNGGKRYFYPRLTFNSGNSLTKNNLFRTTDIIVPLTEYQAEFAHNRSWNLIGNPYPCYFDMHYLNEEFTAPITIWNGSSYVAYSPVDDDLVLSPYEAFFVQCPLDATEMTFKEAGRMHSNEGKTLYKEASRNVETVSAEDRNVFNFVLSGENYEDRARIVFNPDAKSEYEIGRDASKFFAGSNDNAQIYVNADVTYSINERPVCDGLATLGLRSAKENLYTMSLSGSYSDEWSVMLTDNVTGITVDLTKESYQFVSTTTENSTRFSVEFKLNSNGETGIDSIVSDFGEDCIVTVTAINGVVVYSGRLSDIEVPTSGLYLISNGSETRKAILK